MSELGSIGAYLQKIREERKISIIEISEKTKIRQQYLDAIEQGDKTELPDEVYVRGFLRSYAKALSLDPEDVIIRYDNSEREIERDSEQLSRLERRKAARRRKRIRFVISIIVFIIVGGILYYCLI